MRYLITLMLVLFFPALASADEDGKRTPYDGQLTLVIKNLPKFSEYPSEAEPKSEVATDINWKSDPDARRFRTALRKALKKGADFNGHYAVAWYGCGTSCQVEKIIDVNNGKIVGGFTTTYGAAYQKDSSLIVADLPNAQPDLDGEYSLLYQIRYFKVEDDQLIPIKTLDIHSLFKNYED